MKSKHFSQHILLTYDLERADSATHTIFKIALVGPDAVEEQKGNLPESSVLLTQGLNATVIADIIQRAATTAKCKVKAFAFSIGETVYVQHL
jgi:hypothetical protein